MPNTSDSLIQLEKLSKEQIRQLAKSDTLLGNISSNDPCLLLGFSEKDQQHIDLNRKIHNLKSSLRTFKNVVENLKDGYQFDDQFAEAKIKLIEKATENLQPEIDLLSRIYLELRDSND